MNDLNDFDGSDDDHPSESWADGGYNDDEFDYDDYLEREFGEQSSASKTGIFGSGKRGRMLQTGILILLAVCILFWSLGI